MLLWEAPVRIPVVPMAWYMDIFPAEKEFMVVLMKKSATKEWLVITMERINAFVITTVLCAVDGVIMTGQIAGWFICTCAGDVTNVSGTDYCCPAGHVYVNGACGIF